MISIFKNINRLAGKSKILDIFAIFCAKYLFYLMLAFLLLFSFAFHSIGLFFYPLLSGFIAAFILNKIIYVFYKERRPAEFKNTNTLISVPKNPSFPSRHASFSFGISFYLFLYSVPLAIAFLVCSCFIGIARVFCGVHWPRDILAGIFVGLLSVFMTYFLSIYL